MVNGHSTFSAKRYFFQHAMRKYDSNHGNLRTRSLPLFTCYRFCAIVVAAQLNMNVDLKTIHAFERAEPSRLIVFFCSLRFISMSTRCSKCFACKPPNGQHCEFNHYDTSNRHGFEISTAFWNELKCSIEITRQMHSCFFFFFSLDRV